MAANERSATNGQIDPSDDIRVYVQLRPVAEDSLRIQAVQSALPSQKQGRLIGPEELHMTLIHFGKADDAYTKVRSHSYVSRESFDEALTRYIEHTEKLLQVEPIELALHTYELFGPKQTALAARFKATEQLTTLHTELCAALIEFFNDVGVHDPVNFMQSDPNFRLALSCEPHVTLYKGYSGTLPNEQLGMVTFERMQVRY